MRRAHNRKCRRRANTSWTDCENARARARPRAEQRYGTRLRVFAYRPRAVLRSRSPRNLDQLWGLRALPMISRTRFLITAAFVCHLLLAPRLVTSQLRSVPNSTLTPPAASPSQASSAAAPSLPDPLPQAANASQPL